MQHVVQQTTEQLQGEILERQGRSVEQLHHPFVTVELTQRGNGVVGKDAIGLFQDLLEVGVRDNDAEGQLVIRQAGPGGNFFLGETRQIFRHVEAAIRGQAGQQDIFEIQGRCLAAGADIAHGDKPLV
ncbi:hypothetical protein ALQ97_200018 [Pseudomonas savastanoi pv. glycinea]|nr:hypothetical protein ALQ97_200018 [Pseudomonas savastanoi pv. glycinea]